MNARPAKAGATAPTRAALRLLTALAEEGASAIPDPTRPGHLIVRARRGGVSLGRGAHAEAAARDLARHDLAAIDPPSGAIRSVVATDAGVARARRASAHDGDGFQAQHRDTVEEVRDGVRVVANPAESPLEWLRRRRGRDGEPLVDAACFEAGERLRRDLTLGGLLPSVTSRWDGAPGGPGGPRDPASAADATIAARQRARAALARMSEEDADLLVDFCGFLKGLEEIERERDWPARSAKVVIRLALRRLAAHYGLEVEARGPERARGLRSWRGPDEPATIQADPAAAAPTRAGAP